MPCAFHKSHYERSVSGCQFRVHDGDLIEFDGKSWCRFHLPIRAGEAESDKAQWHLDDDFRESILSYVNKAKNGDAVDLSGVIFPQSHIKFCKSSLPKILFVGASFPGGASFEGITFSGDARFDEAVFGIYTTFIGAKFRAQAIFDRARFVRRVYFDNVHFKGTANFNAATFGLHACFTEAIFCRDALFVGDPSREGSIGPADMFSGEATFRLAHFNQRANFSNRRFLDFTSFRDTTFNVAPEFYNAVLHQGTDFTGSKFLDVNGMDDVKASMAYRTLKLAMGSVHDRGGEAKFFALEQKSLLRDKNTPLSTKAFSRLYWLASDYGESVLRPFLGGLSTFAAFLVVYIGFLWFYLDPGSSFVYPAVDFSDLLRFSLQQVFRPFEVFSLRPTLPVEGLHEVVRAPPLPLALLAAMHSTVTISFLALFLLALRRRFRLD
jgi:Pentapeptide repeats (9 copies)